ncbi:MAG: signal peptidase II [Clostridiaceae bacterium]|jgi:signal peptidase II|nr:signal peptidase II [Clostridiaceae bacterium]
MLWFVMIALLVILDQFTKQYVRDNLSLLQSNVVIKDFFYITHVENTGAAFGILKDARIFLITLTVIAAAVLIYLMVKNRSKMMRLSIAFILGGAFGNLIDRVFRGRVTDFLEFDVWIWKDYPVFNIADVCVNIGAGLLFIYLIFIYKEPDAASEKQKPEVSEVVPGDCGNGE